MSDEQKMGKFGQFLENPGSGLHIRRVIEQCFGFH